MMNIKIDKNFLEKLKDEKIDKCFLYFIDAWCKWKKLSYKVLENEEASKIWTFDNIDFLVKDSDIYKFEGSKIKYIWWKIKFFSKKIKEQCGCWSSFNFGELRVSKKWLLSIMDKFKNEIKTIDDNVILEKNTDYLILSWENKKIKVDNLKVAKNKLYWVISDSVEIDLELNSDTEMTVNLLYISGGKDIKSKVHWKLLNDNSKLTLNIICLANKDVNFDIDWIIDIEKDTKNIVWHLSQENILLSPRAKVRWVPRLLAASSDIEASHSCKFEEIDNKKLFYLMSRWLDKTTAKKVMLESMVDRIIWEIKNKDAKKYQELKDFIFKQL